MPEQQIRRPQFVGAFRRNERQNVILDMDTCDALGIKYGHTLALYRTPAGQIVGKVVKTEMMPKETHLYSQGEREIQVWDEPTDHLLWKHDPSDRTYTPYMPEGFLAPEDDRW